MDAALYDPEGGFFARGGGAGRAGSDFLTSPEVGALFGALVARAVDGWWDDLGRPDPFVVVDAGAGRGQLARDVLRAAPRCAPALRYVLVERSEALRAFQGHHLALEPAAEALGPAVAPEPDEAPETVPGLGPVVTSLPELPAGPYTGVVMANELLDNLPFRIVERSAGGAWLEIRVGAADDGRFTEVVLPADDALSAEADALVAGHPVPGGARLPVQGRIGDWFGECGRMLRRGGVVMLDYAEEVEVLIERNGGWLRTYRGHQRGGHPLEDPGSQDITADVALPALRRAAARAGFRAVEETTQTGWLQALGVDDLVAEARAAWDARTANDLAALAARSRVGEAQALTDPAGLGAHRVAVLGKGI